MNKVPRKRELVILSVSVQLEIKEMGKQRPESKGLFRSRHHRLSSHKAQFLLSLFAFKHFLILSGTFVISRGQKSRIIFILS